MFTSSNAFRLGLVGRFASIIGFLGCSGPSQGIETSAIAATAGAPLVEAAAATEATSAIDAAGSTGSEREVPRQAELPADASNRGQRPLHVTGKGEGPFTISERAYRLAARRGSVRAIVHIRSRTRPDGEIEVAPPRDDPGQKPSEDLDDAQDRFLQFLQNREGLTPTRFTSIPYLAVTLRFAEIRELAAANQPGGEFELPSGERVDYSISASPRFKHAELATGASAAQVENPFDKVLDHLKARIRGLSGAGFTVVVIDDGIDPASQFIGGRVVGGHHLIDGVPAFDVAGAPALDPEAGKPDTLDQWSISHGTGVASVIHGVAPEADLVSLRVDQYGEFDGANLLAALVEVEQYWSKVPTIKPIAAICLSLSEETFDDDSTCHVPPEAEAFLDILTRLAGASFPIPVIVAAGNDGLVTTLGFPSCVSTVISVGASTDPSIDGVVDYSARASYSNWSSDLGLVAPGGGFAYDTSNGPYSIGPGTSYAAPFVAGAFALMRERSPASTSAEIFAALQEHGMSVAAAATALGATPSAATRPQIQVLTALEALPTRPR